MVREAWGVLPGHARDDAITALRQNPGPPHSAMAFIFKGWKAQCAWLVGDVGTCLPRWWRIRSVLGLLPLKSAQNCVGGISGESRALAVKSERVWLVATRERAELAT